MDFMGSKTYDFLADSFLFRDDLIEDQFANTPNAEIQQELRRYREFCIGHRDEIVAEVDSSASTLALYSPEPIRILDAKQASLYIDQYVLQDPLLPFTEGPSKMSAVLATAGHFSRGQGQEVRLDDLSRTLRTMKALTPMVAANFVKFVPTSLAFEEPAEVPIYASDNYFEDALPAEILRVFKEAAKVQTLILLDDGSIRLEKLRPCRAISITFKGDLNARGYMYMLHQIEETKQQPDSNENVIIRLSYPHSPPDAGYFTAWVQQSVNQAARSLFEQIYDSAAFASKLNLAYSTRSDLRFRALRKAFKPNTSIPINTANVFMNFHLPFIEDIGLERLMHIRQQEGEAFCNFRFAVESKITSLQSTSDATDAKKRAQEAVREITEVQVHDVQLKIKSIREKLGLAVITASAVNLVAAVQNQGVGLLSAAVASVWPVASTYLDYRRDIKRHPAFFLWKVLPKHRRR